MAKVVIAGGTGLIGKTLEKQLVAEGHAVFILTRSPKAANHIQWDLKKKTIDEEKIQNTEFLINLCGESIGEGKWTDKRKSVLLSSRVGTTVFLFEKFHNQKSLKQYLSASGIDAYPLENPKKEMQEEDAFGSDYLSQLVKRWEEAADVFSRIVPVFKLRISMVLAKDGGALGKMLPLVKIGIASPLGSGSQCNNWVHIEDVVGGFVHGLKNQLEGVYNIAGQTVTNRMFMHELMACHGKKMWAPNVPAFVLKWVMGEQATLVLEGALAKSNKLTESGFNFQFPVLKDALEDLFKQEKG